MGVTGTRSINREKEDLAIEETQKKVGNGKLIRSLDCRQENVWRKVCSVEKEVRLRALGGGPRGEYRARGLRRPFAGVNLENESARESLSPFG